MHLQTETRRRHRWSLLNNHRGSCVLPRGLWCCCELGLGTSSQDLPWGREWGQGYGQHHTPLPARWRPLRSPGHLWHLKGAVPYLLSQTGQPNWAQRLQPPPGLKTSPWQLLFSKRKRRCSTWEAGPFPPMPHPARWQGLFRAKEIVQRYHLVGKWV